MAASFFDLPFGPPSQIFVIALSQREDSFICKNILIATENAFKSDTTDKILASSASQMTYL